MKIKKVREREIYTCTVHVLYTCRFLCLQTQIKMADLVFFKSPKLEQRRLVLNGLTESVSDGVIVFIRSL